MAGQAREYNAPSGREVKVFLLKEIESALNEVHDFTSEAITFPVVRWQWNLKLDVYPREPQTIEVQKTGAHIATDATAKEMTETQPIELEGANAVGAEGMLAADQAREQAGLPVPTLKTDKKTGVSYTEMVQKPPTDEESWTPPGTRSAVIDRGPRLKGGK